LSRPAPRQGSRASLKHGDCVLLLFEFPDRYSDAGGAANGAIDGAAWMTSDRTGDTGDPVPSGTALFVRGWATDLAATGPATDVVLLVDGSEKFHARLGVPRPDVARTHGDAFAACGYEGVITTGRLVPGPHVVTAYSVDADGRRYAQLATQMPFSIVADWMTLPDRTPASEDADGSLDEVVDESRGLRVTPNGRAATVPRGAVLTLRGWFYDPNLPTSGVEAFAVVDGVQAFAATYGATRLDAVELTGTPNVGFDARVPTAGLAPGVHEISIAARAGGPEGPTLRMPVAMRIVVGDMLPARVKLDAMAAAFIDDIVRIQPGVPRDFGAPLRLARGDTLFVRGWAIDEVSVSPAAGVVLLIDRSLEETAVYGLPRGDVAAARGSESFLPTGFTAEIDTTVMEAGKHSVECYVLAADGRGAFGTGQRFDFEVLEA
jgi:hypothetical protein